MLFLPDNQNNIYHDAHGIYIYTASIPAGFNKEHPQSLYMVMVVAIFFVELLLNRLIVLAPFMFKNNTYGDLFLESLHAILISKTETYSRKTSIVSKPRIYLTDLK